MFIPNKKYKSLVQVMSPYGIVEAETIHTTEEWTSILVYEVGENSFNKIFLLID